jgi:hypothetical protein
LCSTWCNAHAACAASEITKDLRARIVVCAVARGTTFPEHVNGMA